MKIKLLLDLFITFFKIGAFTFGGGYAMIPLIQKETVDKKHWIESEDILNIVAIAESTPGPIAVNTSTFVGKKTAGFWGAVFSTLGLVMPSFIIISIISLVIDKFQSYRAVRYAFYGIRAGVVALIIKAVYMMYKQAPKKIISHIIMIGAFVLAAFLKINIIFIVIGCAVVGVVSYFIIEKGEKKHDLS